MISKGEADLLTIAISVAEEAGALVRDQRPDRVDVAHTKSSDVDVVTEMDTRAEALLIDRLMAARPDDGVLGEEGGLRAGGSGITWVIDPIDATVNYLYGVGHYAVSVAAVEGEPDPQGWRQIAGCVYDPVADRRYYAADGAGAFLDGRPLPGPRQAVLARALIGTGFGYLAERRAHQARVLTRVLPRVRDIRRLGCAALDLCYIGAGLLDGYYERGLNPWDQAAGALIAREAGAVVSGPHARLPSREMVIAAGPSLHAELADLLDEADAFRD